MCGEEAVLIIQKIEIQFDIEGQETPQPHWGFLLYTELEKILSYMPGLINSDHSFSYSQYAEPLPSGNLLWHISCWDDKLSYSIARAVNSFSSLIIQDHNKTVKLQVVKSDAKTWSLNELASRFYNGDLQRIMGIQVITPAFHKNEGKYLLFPSLELIFYSIAHRCQVIIESLSFHDKELFTDMIQHTRIWQYELRTVPYEINGSNIVGFRGSFQLHFDGSEELARSSGIVLSLVEFTGIGLRTDKGMGACKVIL